MAVSTPEGLLSLIAPGAQVEVRDEEWLVRSTQQTPSDGVLVRCIGTSTLVRDTEATFFTNLDVISRSAPRTPSSSTTTRRTSARPASTSRRSSARPRSPATNTDLAVAAAPAPQPARVPAPGGAQGAHRPPAPPADRRRGRSRQDARGRDDPVGADPARAGATRSSSSRPRHILEQFQHELWTRFAIPLVRLDSEGIQRVRRQIPANRNPFTYYKRAIISIDTLKNAGRYRHHLEGIRWDAVVIDECHNLVNKGTLNNQLARVLAPRTEALLLTSATPHNGDPKSFAELVRLLDPTAIADPEKITQRRHRAPLRAPPQGAPTRSPPRSDRTGPTASRPSRSPVDADAGRGRALRRAGRHLDPPGRRPGTDVGQGRSLFPWTLFKAALSSHHALIQTIEHRRKTLAVGGRRHAVVPTSNSKPRTRALETLLERAAAITDDTLVEAGGARRATRARSASARGRRPAS